MICADDAGMACDLHREREIQTGRYYMFLDVGSMAKIRGDGMLLSRYGY